MSISSLILHLLLLFLSLFLPSANTLPVVLSHLLQNDTLAEDVATSSCDIDLLQFALNLEYLEAEFFLFGALGHGLDEVAPELAGDGSSPIGAQKANLDWFVRDIIIQFAYQQIGHLSITCRAIQKMVGGFPRPLMDLSATHFAQLMDRAIGFSLEPPFDPYLNDINFLLASYLFPYVTSTCYVGINSLLTGNSTKRLLAGLATVKAAQDAVIRTMLYERAHQALYPYNLNVAQMTDRLSKLRDQLAHLKLKKDGGVIVLSQQDRFGGLTLGNILNADADFVSFTRTPWEVLRIVYGTGTASRPGGFFPVGANGTIAQFYVHTTDDDNGSICGIKPSKIR